MNITLSGQTVTQDTKVINFDKNNPTDIISVLVDTDETWQYQLEVQFPEGCCAVGALYTLINLERVENTCTTVVSNEILPFNGQYIMRLKGQSGDNVFYSEYFDAWIKYSIQPGETYNPIPNQYYQIERNIEELNAHPPIPGDDGYWLIWNLTTKQYEESTFPLPSFDVSNYYTKEQVDSVIETNIENITDGLADGTIVPAKATRATNDAKGNVIDTTYATKTELNDISRSVNLVIVGSFDGAVVSLTEQQMSYLKEGSHVVVSLYSQNEPRTYSLYYVSTSSALPPVHRFETVSETTTDDTGYYFDWTDNTASVTIHKKSELAAKSYVDGLVGNINTILATMFNDVEVTE